MTPADLPRHSVSVAGVIADEQNRALLIRRRDTGRWEPPGGVLELSESIHDGLRREVREETGLEVDPVALTGVYKNMKRGVVALVFRCEAIGGELTTNPEVTEFRWATPDEVRALVVEAFAVRVLDALKTGQVAIREHDGTNLV
ncbi:NUDIX hydrolase [uncultured Thermomonospora sp.]|uniref:NUDIX hydrolase n=1 Tax=uncultured Thermomonospora sp. TaxID=671175 RepID=UPI00259BB861|nr:NUDIX hydrolase [uncultured Thermomonospora sp.]